jgi:MiaB/RimO family radical SAM methylthiotransferase
LLEEGVKEVVLLGQNVNSYHDKSEAALLAQPESTYHTSNGGFSNLYRLRGGAGYYFSDLVEAVSDLDPELRVRFTSPHPKDYPPELLQLMAERSNVCSQLHMPAQSGNTEVLERMRRGYSREAYLQLIDDVRTTIPDVAISSDFIAGFCGETEEEHADTLSLMETIAYDQAYMFAYSMRGKTHAHRSMVDDVDADVKKRRLQEVINVFRTGVQKRNEQVEIGRLRLVLLEGESKRSTPENPALSGRTDQNKRIIFPDEPCFDRAGGAADGGVDVRLQRGDYGVMEVTEAKGHTLRGRLLWRTTLQEFSQLTPEDEIRLKAVHAVQP